MKDAFCKYNLLNEYLPRSGFQIRFTWAFYC